MLSAQRAVNVVLACLACLGGGTSAQSSSRFLLTDIPAPHPAVTVEHTFPGLAHPQHIVAGEDVIALFSVQNGLSKPLNVTFAAGSVNAARNFGLHVQNLTVAAYRSMVPGGTERSFEYRFAMDSRMPPREFTLALTVFYTDGPDPFSHAATYYNGTVVVSEPERLIDTEAVMMWLTLAALAVAIAYAVYSCFDEPAWMRELFGGSKATAGKATYRAKARTLPVNPATVDKSDYLVGTPYYKKDKEGNKKSK